MFKAWVQIPVVLRIEAQACGYYYTVDVPIILFLFYELDNHVFPRIQGHDNITTFIIYYNVRGVRTWTHVRVL